MSATFGLEALLAFGKALADLGATPAVQQYAMTEMAKHAGIPQDQLDKAIAANKDAQSPPGGWDDEKGGKQ